MNKRWVGTELLRAAVQLACAAQIDQAALVHTVDGAAQFNVLAAQFVQVACIAAVLRQSASLVSGLQVSRKRVPSRSCAMS